MRLGTDGNIAFDGKVSEELGDVEGAQVRRMALVVEEDEAACPVDVAVLGAAGVVADAEDVADLIEEARAVAAGTRPQVAGEGVGQPADIGRQLAERPVEDDLLQKDERGASFDVRGGREFGTAAEMIEEGRHFGGAHLLGMPDLMEKDVTASPVDVSLAESGHVAAAAQGVGEAVPQPGRLRGSRGGGGRHD